MTLADIESKAKHYATAREVLSDIVLTMNGEIEDIKRRNMKRLKKAVAEASERHDALKSCIADAPDLFKRPRTVVLHGIKLGYQKGKGKLEIGDNARVCSLIRKHFPELSDTLIATEEKPVKDALNNLSSAELKKIGVHVTAAGDQVVIKPADSAVDKLVEALIKSATEDAEE